MRESFGLHVAVGKLLLEGLEAALGWEFSVRHVVAILLLELDHETGPVGRENDDRLAMSHRLSSSSRNELSLAAKLWSALLSRVYG